MLYHLRSRFVSCINRISYRTLLHEGLSKAHDLVTQAVPVLVGDLQLCAECAYLFSQLIQLLADLGNGWPFSLPASTGAPYLEVVGDAGLGDAPAKTRSAHFSLADEQTVFQELSHSRAGYPKPGRDLIRRQSGSGHTYRVGGGMFPFQVSW